MAVTIAVMRIDVRKNVPQFISKYLLSAIPPSAFETITMKEIATVENPVAIIVASFFV